MKSTLFKTLTILIAVIFIPILFFTVYEISSLNSNEQVLDQIYTNQLDAILFSVNQYSEDVVSSWRNKINNAVSGKNEGLINTFLKQNEPLSYIFIADSSQGENLTVFSKQGNTRNDSITSLQIIGSRKQIIERLYTYGNSGYLKLEPLSLSPDLSAVLFLLDDNSLCGLIFNSAKFINQQLDSKMKSIAGNEFILAVYKPSRNDIILSTDQVNLKEIRQTKSLWLLPQYNLGITLKGKTIYDIVRARTTQNLILIAGITILIFIGIWLVFRNIKKEIQLAQLKADFVSNVSHEA